MNGLTTRQEHMPDTLLLDTADEVARWLQRDGVTPRKLRQWAKRGHITCHPGDLYVAIEVVKYLTERRDTRMADVRLGKTHRSAP